MKHLSFFILLVFISFSVLSQIPDAFSYQAVVRNTSGEIVCDQNVSFRISILQDSDTGDPVYVETHSATTNQYGLATLKIGQGTVIQGVFGPDGWGVAPHFIKVEIDPDGGSSYIHMGTSQLLSVPYAFHAQTVANDSVADADADPENELQSLSLSGSELTISDGNTVSLPEKERLWQQNGDEIYFNNHVGIGTNDPNFELDIVDNSTAAVARIYSSANNAMLVLHRKSTSDVAYTSYRDDEGDRFYTGLLGSNSYMISTDNMSLNGLEVKPNGDVHLSGKLNSSNTAMANMVPFAYGHIKEDGTKNGCTINVEAITKLATGQYEIEIPDLGTNYSVIVTPNQGIAYLTGVVSSRGETFFSVAIWDTKNDEYKNGGFSFVVYKP